MKVWVLTDHYEETSTFAEDTDVLEIPYVKDELSYLDGGYEEERDEFIADIDRIRTRGRGTASIEERFSIELQGVN